MRLEQRAGGSRTFFDITPLVQFAKQHNHVSGVQRVELRVIANILAANPTERIELIALDRVKGCFVRLPKEWCTPSFDFRGTNFRELIGARAASSFDLAKYKTKPIKRTFHRIRRGIGIVSEFRNAEAVRIEPQDTYVLLGISWGDAQHTAAVRSVKEQGAFMTAMIYDLIPVNHPEFVPPSLTEVQETWLAEAYPIYDRFLTISSYVADEVRRDLARRGFSTEVVPTPLAHEFIGERNGKPPEGAFADLTRRPYVLMVGTLEVRKNALAAAQVWRQLLDEMGAGAPILVIAGRVGWGCDALFALLGATASINGHVRVMADASDSTLAWLYSNCLFTVFPSYVEGWGLPIGEALWFGKTCVASNATSIPEAGEDLCLYVDPADLSDFHAKIVSLLDPTHRRRLEDKIRSRRLRTWRDTADLIWKNVQPGTQTVIEGTSPVAV